MRKLLLLTLFITCSFAQVPAEKFLPHMAIHMNKGCQQNSSCTALIGKMNRELDKVLKMGNQSRLDSFQRRYGIPLSFWTLKEDDLNTVTFDSRCARHRKKDSKIYEGIRYIKKTSILLKDPSILMNIAISEDDIDSFYIMPRKALPNGISKGALHFTQEREGLFYYLNLSRQKIHASFNKLPEKEILETSCPLKLRESFAKRQKSANLYKSSFCKKIWNFDKQKYSTLIFGWSCL